MNSNHTLGNFNRNRNIIADYNPIVKSGKSVIKNAHDFSGKSVKSVNEQTSKFAEMLQSREMESIFFELHKILVKYGVSIYQFIQYAEQEVFLNKLSKSMYISKNGNSIVCNLLQNSSNFKNAFILAYKKYESIVKSEENNFFTIAHAIVESIVLEQKELHYRQITAIQIADIINSIANSRVFLIAFQSKNEDYMYKIVRTSLYHKVNSIQSKNDTKPEKEVKRMEKLANNKDNRQKLIKSLIIRKSEQIAKHKKSILHLQSEITNLKEGAAKLQQIRMDLLIQTNAKIEEIFSNVDYRIVYERIEKLNKKYECNMSMWTYLKHSTIEFNKDQRSEIIELYGKVNKLELRVKNLMEKTDSEFDLATKTAIEYNLQKIQSHKDMIKNLEKTEEKDSISKKVKSVKSEAKIEKKVKSVIQPITKKLDLSFEKSEKPLNYTCNHCNSIIRAKLTKGYDKGGIHTTKILCKSCKQIATISFDNNFMER